MTSSNAAAAKKDEPETTQGAPENPTADPIRSLMHDALRGDKKKEVAADVKKAYLEARKGVVDTQAPALELAAKLSRNKIVDILTAHGIKVPDNVLKFQPPIPQKLKGKVAKAVKAPEAPTGEGSSRTTFGEALKRTADGGKIEGFVAQWGKYKTRVAGEDKAGTATAKGMPFASPAERTTVMNAGDALAQAVEAKKPVAEIEAARADFNAVAIPVKQRKTAVAPEVPVTATKTVAETGTVARKAGRPVEGQKKAAEPSAANMRKGVSEAYGRAAEALEHDHPQEFTKALNTYAERYRRFITKLDAEELALARTAALVARNKEAGVESIISQETVDREREAKAKLRPNPKVAAATEKLLAAVGREAPTDELATLFEALGRAKEEKAGSLKLVPDRAVRGSMGSRTVVKDEFDKKGPKRRLPEEKGAHRPERHGYVSLLSPQELARKLRSLESMKGKVARLEARKPHLVEELKQATSEAKPKEILDALEADLKKLDLELQEDKQLIVDSERFLRGAQARIQAALAERVINVDEKPYRLAELRVTRSTIRGGLAVLHGVAMGERDKGDHRSQYEWDCTPENYRSMGLTLETVKDFATGSPEDVDAFITQVRVILAQEAEDREYDRQEALEKVRVHGLPVQDLRFGHTSENRVSHQHGHHRGKPGVQLTIYYGKTVRDGGTGKWAIQTFRPGDALPEGLTPEVLRLAKGSEQYADAWLKESKGDFRPAIEEATRHYEFAEAKRGTGSPGVRRGEGDLKVAAVPAPAPKEPRDEKKGHSRSKTPSRSNIMEKTRKQMEDVKWNKRVARREQEVEASLRAVDPSIATLIDAYKELLKTKETITSLDQIETGLAGVSDETRIKSALALLETVKSAKEIFTAASRADYNEAMERLEKTEKRQKRQH